VRTPLAYTAVLGQQRPRSRPGRHGSLNRGNLWDSVPSGAEHGHGTVFLSMAQAVGGTGLSFAITSRQLRQLLIPAHGFPRPALWPSGVLLMGLMLIFLPARQL